MTYLFVREDVFYSLELEVPEGKTEKEMAAAHAESNPGTLRIENLDTGEVWEF